MFYNILMKKAQTVCITLPPDLLKKAQKLAAREHRTMSELFREALRHYMNERPTEPILRPPFSGVESGAERGVKEESQSSVLHSFRMEKPAK
jgi:Ribbon-helix-helix protein, copG family